jgi:hypothetical protein
VTTKTTNWLLVYADLLPDGAEFCWALTDLDPTLWSRVKSAMADLKARDLQVTELRLRQPIWWFADSTASEVLGRELNSESEPLLHLTDEEARRLADSMLDVDSECDELVFWAHCPDVVQITCLPEGSEEPMTTKPFGASE